MTALIYSSILFHQSIVKMNKADDEEMSMEELSEEEVQQIAGEFRRLSSIHTASKAQKTLWESKIYKKSTSVVWFL